MRALDVLRSSAFRVALAFALAMTAATSLIFGVVYLQIITSNEASVRLILVDEAAKGANDTDAELKSALDLRLTRDLRRLDYVALFDAAGKIVIGNIDAMPAIAVDGKSHFVAAVAARRASLTDRSRPYSSRVGAPMAARWCSGEACWRSMRCARRCSSRWRRGLLPTAAAGLRDRRVLCAPHVAPALPDPRNDRAGSCKAIFTCACRCASGRTKWTRSPAM